MFCTLISCGISLISIFVGNPIPFECSMVSTLPATTKGEAMDRESARRVLSEVKTPKWVEKALDWFFHNASISDMADFVRPMAHAFATTGDNDIRQQIADMWDDFAEAGHMPAIVEALQPYAEGGDRVSEADAGFVAFCERLVGTLFPDGTVFRVEG